MRPTKTFVTLQTAATARFARLRRDADRSLTVLSSHGTTWEQRRESRQVIAYCTIEALNVWANFVRSYYLSCTLSPYRVSRSRVSYANAGVGNFVDAVRLATSLYKPNRVPPTGPVQRRDEPTWHDPSVFLRCCVALACSHTSDVTDALSVQTRVLLDLPIFRNFFAHRNARTEIAAQSAALTYSIPSYHHPVDILRTAPIRRPFPLLLEWLDELQVLVELLCD